MYEMNAKHLHPERILTITEDNYNDEDAYVNWDMWDSLGLYRKSISMSNAQRRKVKRTAEKSQTHSAASLLSTEPQK